MTKWIFGSLGVIVAVAHIGILGHLVKDDPVQLSYPPTGEYSTYSVTVNPDGSYTIDYKSHDPSLVTTETYTDSSSGVFGVGGRSTTTTTRHHVPGVPGSGVDHEGGKLSAEDIACIQAAGGGRSNGALVGGSVATGIAPAVTGIPYVGWLAAGWLVLFGQDVGGQIGEQVATSVKGC